MIQILPLALGLTLGASAASTPAIAPGTYTYNASLNGQAVATSVITITADGSSTVLTEKGSGSAQGQSGNASATLTLGPDLAPTAYEAQGSIGSQALKDSASFNGSSASVTGMQGTKSFNLLGSTKHFVVVDLGTFAGFVALPAQMKAWNNAAVLAVIPSYGQSLPIVPDATQQPARPASVPGTDVALAFGGSVPFTVWYNPATLVTDEVDVTSQGLSVTRKQ